MFRYQRHALRLQYFDRGLHPLQSAQCLARYRTGLIRNLWKINVDEVSLRREFAKVAEILAEVLIIYWESYYRLKRLNSSILWDSFYCHCCPQEITLEQINLASEGQQRQPPTWGVPRTLCFPCCSWRKVASWMNPLPSELLAISLHFLYWIVSAISLALYSYYIELFLT